MFLGVLPYVSLFFSLFMIAFCAWLIYYSYEGTKLQNPRRTQSYVTMIIAIILLLFSVFYFFWSVAHLYKMHSENEKMKKASKETTPQANVSAVRDMNSTPVYVNDSYGSYSASTPLNIGQDRRSYSSADFVSAKQASEIRDAVRSSTE